MQILREEEPVHSWRDGLLLKLLIKGAGWRARETTAKTPKEKNKRCSLQEKVVSVPVLWAAEDRRLPGSEKNRLEEAAPAHA